MRKYKKRLTLIMLVMLMMTNSLSVLGAEGSDLGSWETKANMMSVRTDLGVVEANGKIYAIGGYKVGGLQDTIEEYDPATDTWTTKASMSVARRGIGVAEVNGKIYVIGGYDDSTVISIVEEYDPATDTWTIKSSMPTARRELGVAEAKGKIYAIGGYDDSGRLAMVEEYDPITDTWTTKSSMPTARNGLGVVEVNDKIYAIGGDDYSIGDLSIVEEYNPVTDIWTAKASMPTARRIFGVTEANGNIYAIGGMDSSGRFAVVEEYNPVTDTWVTKASMLTTRSGLGAAEANGKIYAIGGYNTFTLATVEEFTPYINTTIVIDTPTNLIATPNNNSIILNWDVVTDTDSYTILRSTTSGVIDTVIASNITDTTYTDTNVTPGVTYYYVVRAVKNGAESADSNIASAMIEISNNRALLLIKLLDENDKEYDLAMSDVDTFMNWYFNRGIGQGPVYYAFTKDYNTGPYISRKEYISYDKIICIEVNEYTK